MISENAEKIVKVIQSCKTEFHIGVALMMFINWKAQSSNTAQDFIDRIVMMWELDEAKKRIC